MWLAVHRGKVLFDSGLLRREDVATATVFGRLRYLPWDEGVGAWLGSIGIDTSSGQVEFWTLRDGTEPDIVMRAAGVVVLVEVKVDASFGVRQLGREWRWMVEHGDGARPELVVLARDLHDADAVHRKLVEDLDAIGHPVPRPARDAVRTTSWSRLARWVSGRRHGATPHIASCLDDITSYLEWHGLTIERFHGWHAVPPAGVPGLGGFLRATAERMFDHAVPPGTLPAGGWFR